jgi:hypothetical protein
MAPAGTAGAAWRRVRLREQDAAEQALRAARVRAFMGFGAGGLAGMGRLAAGAGALA